MAACWQCLEIMVRIGYMHNAAHPQSLPPVGTKKQLPGRASPYLKVPPWAPPTCPQPCGRVNGPPALLLFIEPRHRQSPVGWPGVQATARYKHHMMHASLGTPCQRTPVWGRGGRATLPLRPVPSLACRPRVPLLGACPLCAPPLRSLPSFSCCSQFPRHHKATLCSFWAVSRSRPLPTTANRGFVHLRPTALRSPISINPRQLLLARCIHRASRMLLHPPNRSSLAICTCAATVTVACLVSGNQT